MIAVYPNGTGLSVTKSPDEKKQGHSCAPAFSVFSDGDPNIVVRIGFQAGIYKFDALYPVFYGWILEGSRISARFPCNQMNAEPAVQVTERLVKSFDMTGWQTAKFLCCPDTDSRGWLCKSAAAG